MPPPPRSPPRRCCVAASAATGARSTVVTTTATLCCRFCHHRRAQHRGHQHNDIALQHPSPATYAVCSVACAALQLGYRGETHGDAAPGFAAPVPRDEKHRWSQFCSAGGRKLCCNARGAALSDGGAARSGASRESMRDARKQRCWDGKRMSGGAAFLLWIRIGGGRSGQGHVASGDGGLRETEISQLQRIDYHLVCACFVCLLPFRSAAWTKRGKTPVQVKIVAC